MLIIYLPNVLCYGWNSATKMVEHTFIIRLYSSFQNWRMLFLLCGFYYIISFIIMNKKNANHSTGNVAHGGLVQRLDNLYNNYTIEMLLKSAEDGDAIAQYTLGKRYSNGEDVSQSDEEAAKWFRMSAEQGHDEAAEELRRLESNGSSEKTSKQPSRSGCSVMLVISVLFLLSLFLSL